VKLSLHEKFHGRFRQSKADKEIWHQRLSEWFIVVPITMTSRCLSMFHETLHVTLYVHVTLHQTFTTSKRSLIAWRFHEVTRRRVMQCYLYYNLQHCDVTTFCVVYIPANKPFSSACLKLFDCSKMVPGVLAVIVLAHAWHMFICLGNNNNLSPAIWQVSVNGVIDFS